MKTTDNRADAARTTAPGLRLTRLRRQVLDFLVAAGEPVKAYALIDALRVNAEKPLTPASVYRTLDFLQQHGLVHRVGALNAFVACTDHCQRQHQHAPVFMLVCDSCRQSREVSDRSLYETLFTAMKAQGFCLQGGTIELTGICPTCSAGGAGLKNA